MLKQFDIFKDNLVYLVSGLNNIMEPNKCYWRKEFHKSSMNLWLRIEIHITFPKASICNRESSLLNILYKKLYRAKQELPNKLKIPEICDKFEGLFYDSS